MMKSKVTSEGPDAWKFLLLAEAKGGQQNMNSFGEFMGKKPAVVAEVRILHATKINIQTAVPTT